MSPRALLRFHLIATAVFAAMIPPAMLWWANSVPFLVAISVWANFAGHFSAWQAARVEVKADDSREDQA